MKSNKSVLVIGMNGVGLMPTTPRKARVLLQSGKAEVYRKAPFTIKLLYKTGSATQDIVLGIDTGSQHIGVSIVTGNAVQLKDEHVLRSTMEKRQLNENRAEARRNRRYRKTRYRKPKFKPHTKHMYKEKTTTRHGHKTHWHKVKNEFCTNCEPGWLPSSIQQKVDHHIQIISRYQEALPVRTKTRIEIGRFDMQKIRNPEIEGVQYQLGRMYYFENVKAYVLAKYNYQCPICGRKFGSKRKDGSTVKMRMHHRDYVSNGATDNPDSYIPVCECCHTTQEHAGGGKLDKLMKDSKKSLRGMRDMTFMNILRKRIWNAFPDAEYTYGNITDADRKWLSLPKTHANDAVAVAMHEWIQHTGLREVKDVPYTTVYREVRKKKRSLHEMNPRKGRSKPNTGAVRNSKNTKSVTNRSGTFCLYDKVKYMGQIGWITGFSGNTSIFIRTENGQYLHRDGGKDTHIQVSKVMQINHNNNWICYTK